MTARNPDQEANQWPGAPPAAKHKAAEVEDDFTREGTETAPERSSAARVDDSPGAEGVPDTATAEPVGHDTAGREAASHDAPGRESTVPRTPAPEVSDADAVGTEPVPGAPAPEPVDGQATLLEPDHSEDFRRRWDAIKASFVDDPREAVRRAEQLAEEVVAEVARTVDARRRDLIERREGIGEEDDTTRTEHLRVVLHGYRSVLDPVLRR